MCAEVALRGGLHIFERRLGGDVAAYGERARTDRGGVRLGPFAVDVGEHDLRAPPRKALGRGEADAAGRASDDGDLVLQWRHVFPPALSRRLSLRAAE